MGKIIVLGLIVFLFYWARKYYLATHKSTDKKYSSEENMDTADDLMAYYDKKIDEIESKSVEEIEKAQEKLTYYKSQLEKLKQLKKNKL